MPTFFLDTSALVKLYVQELGTDNMLQLASEPGTQLTILNLAKAEACSAFHRRRRMGDMDWSTCQDLIDQLQTHVRSAFSVVNLIDPMVERARGLLGDYELRAYDAIQLASCLSLRTTHPETTFVGSDHRLLNAASDEGLPILNPETQVRHTANKG